MLKSLDQISTILMDKQKNVLKELMPDNARFTSVVHVYDLRGNDLRLLSDIVTQKMICFFGNQTQIYPARLRLGDNSTIKFHCTSFLKFGSH